MLHVGLRVVQGPNWFDDEHEYCDGHIGTVISISDNCQKVEVDWDIRDVVEDNGGYAHQDHT